MVMGSWHGVWSMTAEFAAVLSSHGYAVGHIDIHCVHSGGGLRIHPFCQSRILIDRDPVPRGFLSCHAALTCTHVRSLTDVNAAANTAVPYHAKG